MAPDPAVKSITVGAVAVTNGFSAAVERVNGVEGWLSDGQARRLWDCAQRVPAAGRIVEIGSFRGRSTIVLALASWSEVEIVAIDPHGGGDRGPNEIAPDAGRGESDNAVFRRNLHDAGVEGRVRHVRAMSSQASGDVRGTVDLLYIDGAHRYAPARDDIASWGARVSTGGTLVIHDSFNAIGVTLALLRLLAFGSEYRYVGRTASMAEYHREAVHGIARVVNAGRQLAQLGYFTRMIAVKLALTAHAYPVARALGHPSREWPY
jgi:predicted O-methyltransferase YrrM